MMNNGKNHQHDESKSYSWLCPDNIWKDDEDGKGQEKGETKDDEDEKDERRESQESMLDVKQW